MTSEPLLENLATLTRVLDDNLFFRNGSGPETVIGSFDGLRDYWVCGHDSVEQEVHLRRNSGQGIRLPMTHYKSLKSSYAGKDREVLDLMEQIEIEVYGKNGGIGHYRGSRKS